MPAYSNINGVWRESKPYSNVGGIWNDKEGYTKIDGVWRKFYNKGIAISSLSVGDKVKLGAYQVNIETALPITWRVAAKNQSCTPAYPADAITLITEKIIDLRAVDAAEPLNSVTARQIGGNSLYSVSNIDQWLNKDSTAGTWYASAHPADAPPGTSASVSSYKTQYSAKAGFLHLFTAAEKALFLNTTIRVTRSEVDGSGYEDISRKIFLPSRTEVGLGNEYGIAEGALWSLFSTASNRISYLTQQAYDNTPSSSKPTTVGTAWKWRVRTPVMESSGVTRLVVIDGTLSNDQSYRGQYGFRPACNIPSTTLVSATTDADGCYVF